MEDKSTRTTPEPIARQLRQEAAFGCCRCGFPIIQYHHIVPYADDHHFRTQDMMALCPNCHDAANNGALTQYEQRQLKAIPYNVERGYASGFLKINDPTLQIGMGSNIFIGGGDIIQADKQSLVALNLNKYGSIELRICLYDQQDRLILLIENNEWISGDRSPWDIDASYQKLKIREKKGQIALDLNLKNTPIRLKARLWWKGHLISISTSSLNVDRTTVNIQFTGCVFEGYGIHFSTGPIMALEIGPTLTL